MHAAVAAPGSTMSQSSMITDRSPIEFADPLPNAVDVVVIGAGIAGTACAYFLAQHGVSVLLCEKGRVAGEQSSRNWGWVRQQGRDWAELPIMMEANRIWRGLAGQTGDADLAFTQTGCLYLIETQAQQAKYEGWYDLALRHQLGTRLLSKAELEAQHPGIAGNWLGAMVTPSDGCAEPSVAVPALARAARRAGVRIVESCAVRTLDVEGGRVVGVTTEKGRVRAAQVLLAGGAWSTHFLANAGLDLPQLSVRSTVTRTTPGPASYAGNIAAPGLAIRRRKDGGYTVATGDLAEHYLSAGSFRYLPRFANLLRSSGKHVRIRLGAPRHFPGAWGAPRRWTGDETSPFERMRVLDPVPSPIVVRRVEERLAKRFPALSGVKVAQAWAGMIDVTPDAVPVLGEDHRLPGLYLATGLSGHGFGIGPAIGRIMADILRGRSPGHDLHRFRSGRFFDGSPMVPGPY
ncbi:MAG: FAD-binding oxidoreductase [Hyphomicrobiaceae bacterium]|nr:FAD-binding oxidoreductase [Hyphomicrobiaceae bacterium]